MLWELKTVQVNFVVHFTVLVLCLLRNLLEQSLQDATSKWLRFQCARCFKIFPWKGLWHYAKICDTMTGFVTFCLCTTLNRFQWILPAILCNLTLFCCCCCSQYKFWRFFFPFLKSGYFERTFCYPRILLKRTKQFNQSTLMFLVCHPVIC